MKIYKTKLLNQKQKEEINHLWNKEYPNNLKHAELRKFEEYLSNLGEQHHILLIDENESVKGWYFDFKRNNERWFAMIIDSKLHRRGFGKKLLNHAKETNFELNGWVIDQNHYQKENGERYTSPINFYKKNKFEVLDEVRLETDKISAVKIKWHK
ncbi:GNAT family N-acetyltransferase [Xanthovirga aplysinae]|uniref:GNAT family N-acetyltransferase n=1 Tax=Xanthovirga aplysinae TaxID=2529853 RepID=UPI0012BD3D7B|nr:GNAT family N-acetyltransferase [Xanthovirga aplysinae]MTI30924.1 N-acetyltransferase [Xanthovirga aplysinae]